MVTLLPLLPKYTESKHFSIPPLAQSEFKTSLISPLRLVSSWLSMYLLHGNQSNQNIHLILPFLCLIHSFGFSVNSLTSSTRTPKSSTDFSTISFSPSLILVPMAFVLYHIRPAPIAIVFSAGNNHSPLGLHTAAFFSSFKSPLSIPNSLSKLCLYILLSNFPTPFLEHKLVKGEFMFPLSLFPRIQNRA